MKRAHIVWTTVLCVFLIAGCTTAKSAAGTQDGATVADSTQTVSPPDAGGDTAALAEMRSYIENAQKKMDEMAVSEAVSMYVAALGVSKTIRTPSKEIRELASSVDTELTRIESAFLMQAGTEWLDENENQMAASTFLAGKGDALSPKVMLWYNVGGSRIAVSAAPILFQFVKGSGLITGFTTTNEYGEASVPIGKIDDPNRETVVRASLAYTVKGFTYAFSQTKVEFVWVPPSKRATILVLERGPDYAADDPYIFNPVYNTLKKMEFDFIPYNGRLLGDAFTSVFGGDLKSIKGLSIERNVPYLVTVFNDCYSVRKLPRFNSVFLGEGKATLRIIRIADGKILFEAVGYADRAHDSHGQGNSEATTMRNVFVRATDDLVRALGQKTKEINKALGLQ